MLLLLSCSCLKPLQASTAEGNSDMAALVAISTSSWGVLENTLGENRKPFMPAVTEGNLGEQQVKSLECACGSR